MCLGFECKNLRALFTLFEKLQFLLRSFFLAAGPILTPLLCIVYIMSTLFLAPGLQCGSLIKHNISTISAEIIQFWNKILTQGPFISSMLRSLFQKKCLSDRPSVSEPPFWNGWTILVTFQNRQSDNHAPFTQWLARYVEVWKYIGFLLSQALFISFLTWLLLSPENSVYIVTGSAST